METSHAVGCAVAADDDDDGEEEDEEKDTTAKTVKVHVPVRSYKLGC